MKRFVILALCALMLLSLTACAAEDKGPNPEFQNLAEQTGIADLIFEPSCKDGEEFARYISYVDDVEIPFVEVVTFVYNKRSDEVTYVQYDFFYLMEGLGYSTEEVETAADALLEYFEDNMAVGSMLVRVRDMSFANMIWITVSCLDMDSRLCRADMVKVGLLESDDPVSFKASDKSMLADGYIKQ